MNTWLLDKVLRQEWGFDGLIVSDYYGIPQLVSLHKTAADKADAARAAIEAGVDIELPDPEANVTLVQLVKDGKVSEATLDRAVARNHRAKFLLGLFENPYVDVERAVRVTNSQDEFNRMIGKDPEVDEKKPLATSRPLTGGLAGRR
jgi:beta-glucosidase